MRRFSIRYVNEENDILRADYYKESYSMVHFYHYDCEEVGWIVASYNTSRISEIILMGEITQETDNES